MDRDHRPGDSVVQMRELVDPRRPRAAALTTYQIRQYQLARRAAGAATGTINRETSALHRMGTLAVHWGWLDTVPGFPDRLRENPPRQGFFEHPEYLTVRAHLPAVGDQKSCFQRSEVLILPQGPQFSGHKTTFRELENAHCGSIRRSEVLIPDRPETPRQSGTNPAWPRRVMFAASSVPTAGSSKIGR